MLDELVIKSRPVLFAVMASVSLLCPSCGASKTNYVSGFRPAYLPVVATLNRVTPACASPALKVAQLPHCGTRVAAFQAAVSRLQRFVTHTPPPPKAKATNRELVASLRVMQDTFTILAAFIKRNDIADFLAMGGVDKPIYNSIQAFIGAIEALDAVLPGKSLPLPGD
jgi:hypothetical protein